MRTSVKSTLLSALSAVALLSSAASAQSTIYALDVRLGRFIKTDTGNFVTNLTVIGANANPVFALDFDQTATTVWGINNTTVQYGTFDLTTGAFNPVASLVGIPAGNFSGVSCDTNGVWWLSVIDTATGATNLWKGSLPLGLFTLVGQITPSGAAVIAIAIDAAGNLYGNQFVADQLISISTTTGLGT
jgi:hypothetical protein